MNNTMRERRGWQIRLGSREEPLDAARDPSRDNALKMSWLGVSAQGDMIHVYD
jgi:hypothetical protein